MRIMAKTKIIKKYTGIITGLLGVSVILLTTGCEVQKVGTTPSKDYIVAPIPPEAIPWTPAADDGTIQDIKNNRIDELMDVLDEVEGKAIIWANYQLSVGEIIQRIIKE